MENRSRRVSLTGTPLWRLAAAFWRQSASLIKVAQLINDPEPDPDELHIPRGEPAQKYSVAVVYTGTPGALKRTIRFLVSLPPALAAYGIAILALVPTLLAVIVWAATAPFYRAGPVQPVDGRLEAGDVEGRTHTD